MEPANIPRMRTAPGVLEAIKAADPETEISLNYIKVLIRTEAVARYFGRPCPPEEWRCTMALAASLGLPGKLEDAGAALGLDRQKMVEGKRLIQAFSKPNRDGARRMPEDAPEDWELFREYNIRDVDVECDIRDALSRFPRPPEELAAWTLDQQINDRGVALDATLVAQAIALDRQSSQELKDEARTLTGVENPNSPAQLKAWLPIDVECQPWS